VGLGKNQQARVIQLLATLLNLGQLQFMDNPNVQEAAIIKNRDMLELVSDGLGVDAGTLENVLTYKTQLIKKDVTTLILNAEQSSLQRDEFAITLYSALFDWLVDFLNQKLNNENAHNFIGILDFPGTVSSSSSDEGYHRLSLNYCNERIQEYIQRYVFQVQGQEYGEDGLDYPPVSSDITHHLLEHDLMHLVQSYSKKITNSSANENEFIRAVNKNLSERPSFQIFQSETGATLFSIQHFHGQQIYNPNLLLEESRITTGDSPDFVTLFKGSTGMSCNGFLSTLFDKPPMKSKGMRSALDSLFEKLDGTVPWVIYCLRSSHGSTFDSQLVHAQVVERDLVKTAIRLQTGSFLNVYTFDDFSERYSNVLTHFGIYKDTPKVQCEKLMHLMNWNIKKEADIGSTKVKKKEKKKKRKFLHLMYKANNNDQ
jgi:chitin synthase